MADTVLIIILAVALLWGWRLGTIRVLAGLGSLVVAYQVARIYSGQFAAQITYTLPQLDPGSREGQIITLLSLIVDTDALANRILQIVLFLVIFVVVRWLIRKVAYLLTSLFGRGLLGSINRAVGAFLATLLAAALLVITYSVVLPACAKLGLAFSAPALDFLHTSQLVLPLLLAAPQLLGF